MRGSPRKLTTSSADVAVVWLMIIVAVDGEHDPTDGERPGLFARGFRSASLPTLGRPVRREAPGIKAGSRFEAGEPGGGQRAGIHLGETPPAACLMRARQRPQGGDKGRRAGRARPGRRAGPTQRAAHLEFRNYWAA